ncbi:DUF2867 domain-containing protein [Poriferisphaera sp. WC338]|uniref:DUF2867 domain-containing protein n=1 Tax=Poriferisphaera sp. WC338 TaxID=3425129 RepID=UPI003D818ADA
MPHLPDNSVLSSYTQGADHVDVKHIDGHVNLRQFIAGFLGYYPWWLKCLYGIRIIVAKLLRLKTAVAPMTLTLAPNNISFTPDQLALFFIVREAKEGRYWIAESPDDTHLTAWIAVQTTPSIDQQNKFSVTTIVKYKSWSGPVYFNLIRPFHHLVVRAMMKSGVRKFA